MDDKEQDAHVKRYLSARIPRHTQRPLAPQLVSTKKDLGGQKKGSNRSGRRLSSTQLEQMEESRVGKGSACEKRDVISERAEVKYYENDEPFVVQKLVAKNRRCYGCQIDFLHKAVVAPDDVIIVHRERYEHKDKVEGWNKPHLSHYFTRPSAYHCRASCLRKRGFRPEYLAASILQVPNTLHLSEIHKAHLESLKTCFKCI